MRHRKLMLSFRNTLMLSGIALFTSSGCTNRNLAARAPSVTQERIQKEGSWTYLGSMEEVARATIMALQSEGFLIALQNPSRGLIITRPRDLGSTAQLYAYGHTARAYSTQYSIQFVVHLERSGNQRIQVALEPRVYVNHIHRPDVEWDLGYLRSTWSTILNRIHDALPQRAAPTPPERPLETPPD